MARRKTLLVIIILGLMALFLSPWTSSPVPAPEPSTLPQQPMEPLDVATLAAEESPADLAIAAVIDQDGFERLRGQSDDYQVRHPDVNVRWTRIDPASATLGEDIEAGMETSDLMLVPNEWVRDLAVDGELQPLDSAFGGDELSEQFAAVISQVKWNGYLWGVPRDIDPYVLVWNRNVLNALQPETGAVTPPLTLEQWESLPGLLADKGLIASWLAIDGTDPLALLAWFGAATGQGQDELFDRSSNIWNSDAFDRVLKLMEEQHAGIANADGSADFWAAFAAGQYAAAFVRSSEARQALTELPDSARSAFMVDRSLWNNSFVWPNGTSFVLSSHSAQGDAAKRWLTEMTDPGSQLENYEDDRVLPVSRSVYGRLDVQDAALASTSAQTFPNQASTAAGPGLPERFDRVKALWNDWFHGRLSAKDWKEQWLGLLADMETND